jgi:predicted Zn-dependent protease
MESIFQNRSCLSRKEIRQYLEGQMTAGQQHTVENHLLDCPICSDAVEGLANDVDTTLTGQHIEQLSKRISERGAQAALPSKKQWPRRAVWLAIAALLVLLAYVVHQYQQQTRGERLVAAYFTEPASEYLLLRGDLPPEASIDISLEQALQLYKEEQYEKSITYFRSYLNKQSEDKAARLLMATAYLNAGDGNRAEEVLLRMQAERFGAPAQLQWYLALAYLSQGKMIKSRQLLEKLASSSPVYQNKARELLEKL